jgi:histidine triad (HIT) family protein
LEFAGVYGNCPFCDIVSGNKNYQEVLSNNVLIAAMDHRPVSKGHIIIFPREHYENIYDIPDDILAEISLTSKKVSLALKKAYNPPGLNIIQNNGQLAGQTVFHFHVHIIPRYDNGYLNYLIEVAKNRKVASDNYLLKEANYIKAHLD